MNIFTRTTSLAFAIALCSICTSISVQAAVPATLTTYTDRTAWEAAVISAGLSLQTEDFNSFNPQPISGSSLAGIDHFQRQSLALPSIGLSLFHANTTPSFDDNVVHVGPGDDLKINDTNFIRVDDNPANLQITVTSTGILSSFGFDYKGFGGGGEGLSVTINGNAEYLGDLALAGDFEATPSAFFGFVDTDLGNAYTLFQTTGTDGAFGLDNLSVGLVPEPSSSMLLSIAGLVLIGKRKR